LFDLVQLQLLCNHSGVNGVAVWTAGKREHVNKNHWYWKTGAHSKETMGYTNWYRPTGEPNNHGGHEDCLMMWKDHNYQWNDEPCDHQYCFVCEKAWNDDI